MMEMAHECILLVVVWWIKLVLSPIKQVARISVNVTKAPTKSFIICRKKILTFIPAL
jgi:hypothetical protein